MNEKAFVLRKRLWTIVFVAIIVVVVIVYWWVCLPGSATTVFLVRHADKAGPNIDDLHDPLGTDRAEKLVHVLGSAEITAIYHSDTVRSQKTGAPLAGHLQMTPVEYPALSTQQLAAEIRANHAGERVLVVGHSNTVPDIIDELGGVRLADIPDSVYDNLYVITLCPCALGTPPVVNMKYGAPTPP
jgi:broad specificity phosphatase PhoE